MRLTEIPFEVVLQILSFLNTDYCHRLFAQTAYSTNHGTIVTEISIPVQFNKIFKDSLGKIQGSQASLIAGLLDDSSYLTHRPPPCKLTSFPIISRIAGRVTILSTNPCSKRNSAF